MKTVNCEGIEYLAHEAEGNAARWIMPLAQYYCKGRGLDIGFSKIEWKMPGAIGIDECLGSEEHAMNIMSDRDGKPYDYIFSSHCLEHVKENWCNVLDYWLTKIKVGGILFLYLPHSSQRYWQPRNNRKHVHSFSGDEIGEYLKGLGHQTFVSGVDANHSFSVICEKSAPKKVAGWANIDAGNDIPTMQEYLQSKGIYPTIEPGTVVGYNKDNSNQKSDQELFCNYLHHINSNEHYDCSKEVDKTKAHYMAEVLNFAQSDNIRLDRAIEAAYEAGRLSK